ncbi:hypothetical protein FRC11_013259 [Ceratobasidium sp. 423]|nr:hypothetical protein FRC11_013259 [Ceratobasidium sp. 423]
MGGRLPFPDVPAENIVEIYKQSLRQSIHAYGFYVDLPELHKKKRGTLDPSISVIDDMFTLLWDVELELRATGLHELSIASIPVPKRRRTMYSGDEAWLVILGTGFNKTPHVPITDELTQRVRNILCAEEEPTWWLLKSFSYPHPILWMQHDMYPTQGVEG